MIEELLPPELAQARKRIIRAMLDKHPIFRTETWGADWEELRIFSELGWLPIVIKSVSGETIYYGGIQLIMSGLDENGKPKIHIGVSEDVRDKETSA